ncbi:branched-chain amino acid ABC transporter substrate-binding protein [Brachymonas denitrificans]|uniref:Amino acid/amide ABC transporter substrate-binding protein, HAAT family n=1 Tax=Brachymonas denitrificans DSM 15123 TaxID=1121117 RepID=A0A1H8INZ2_9BURK|nr:branched-chain amino acid ABC transporter substrate-binding protein [Brachymonas denitrificans]SEN69785.1 amino acid/amide ABC transporter substrate-binding protein, HAAT family [Brachymonas denitrificans DSM 15123]
MQRSLTLSLNVLALAALVAVAGCSKQEPAAGAATSGAAPAAATADAGAVEVPFGTVGPISGGIAHIGKDVENGVRLALDEVNASKPTIGGKPVHFTVVAEDDAGDPKQATAVAQKMCDSKVVAVVGHLQSGTTIPASDIYAKCGIPMITASATNPDLTKPGHKNVFRLIANDNQLGEAVAVYAAQNGVKNVAIVDDRTAFGQGLAVVFKAAADKNGMQVVANEFTTDKATDFMAILTAIKAKKPDAILFGGLDAQAGPMLRQMGQLGLDNVKLFGGDAICTEKLPELASNSKTVENVICATGGSSVQKMAGGPEWLKGYEAKYPKQFQIYSPYAYDATRVLVEAMKAADSTDPAVYLPKLAATNFKGLTGEISFTDKGELQKPAVTLYTYKDGKRVEM